MRLCTVSGCSQKHSAQGLCVRHYSERRRLFSTIRCSDCKKPCTRLRCRTCANNRRREKRPDCSVDGCQEPHQAKGYCKAHYAVFARPNQPRSNCIDCGNPCWYAGGRCRWCLNAHRRNQPRPHCTATGCNRPTRARGLCKSHYEVQRVRGEERWLTKTLREQFQKLPCQLCGYNQTSSHAHRLIPKDGYVEGNVVALCPNCHQEVHRGLVEPPSPLTFSNV